MANVHSEQGRVLQGKYEGCLVYVWETNRSLSIHSERIMTSLLTDNRYTSKLFIISGDSIKSTQDIGSSVQGADPGTVLKAGFWFGAAGAIVAGSLGNQSTYLVAVEYLNGEKSLLRLNTLGYNTFKSIEFALQNNISETSQDLPEVTVKSRESWVCGKCGESNIGAVTYCAKCGGSSPSRYDSDNSSLISREPNANEWKCKKCGSINQNYVGSCGCGMLKRNNDNYTPTTTIEQEKTIEQEVVVTKKAEVPQNVSTNVDKTTLTVADIIKKYKELLDIGAITQDEFDRKKKELLGF